MYDDLCFVLAISDNDSLPSWQLCILSQIYQYCPPWDLIWDHTNTSIARHEIPIGVSVDGNFFFLWDYFRNLILFLLRLFYIFGNFLNTFIRNSYGQINKRKIVYKQIFFKCFNFIYIFLFRIKAIMYDKYRTLI